MKKRIFFLGILIALSLAATPSFSTVYTMIPSPADMWGLDHNYYYTWGFEWEHQDERIVDVILTFNNIYDWRVEYGDTLHINLLDDPPIGSYYGYEGYVPGNYFDGQGVNVGSWSDPNGGVPINYNLSFKFSELGLVQDFTDFVEDGAGGFGFDPDCHYYNSGLELSVVTAVPEPGTMMLLSMGLLGMSAFVRRKK